MSHRRKISVEKDIKRLLRAIGTPHRMLLPGIIKISKGPENPPRYLRQKELNNSNLSQSLHLLFKRSRCLFGLLRVTQVTPS